MLRSATMMMFVASVARSQTTVSGLVFDGVGNRPLAGAVVQLVQADNPASKPRSVVVDSSGAFAIAGVLPGKYLIGFEHPRVFELGIILPPQPIEVNPATPQLRVQIGIPGPRALARVLCRGKPADSSGAFGGRVLDADTRMHKSGAQVVISWTELRISGTEMERIPIVHKAVTDEAGRFAVCGLPTEIPVRVQARAGMQQSSEVDLQVMRLQLLERDLLVARVESVTVAGLARASGKSRLTGVVRRPNGEIIERAQVLVSGSHAFSNSQGKFDVDSLPAGTQMLEVRALGYAPMNRAVDLRSDSTVSADVMMIERVASLEAVTVYGNAPPRRDVQGQFIERSRGAYGRFFTKNQISESGFTNLIDMLRIVPGLRIGQVQGSSVSTVFSRGDEDFNTPCQPDVFIDGIYVNDGASALENLVTIRELGGIEIYIDPNTVPPQFRRRSCGALVFWTKIMVPG